MTNRSFGRSPVGGPPPPPPPQRNMDRDSAKRKRQGSIAIIPPRQPPPQHRLSEPHYQPSPPRHGRRATQSQSNSTNSGTASAALPSLNLQTLGHYKNSSPTSHGGYKNSSPTSHGGSNNHLSPQHARQQPRFDSGDELDRLTERLSPRDIVSSARDEAGDVNVGFRSSLHVQPQRSPRRSPRRVANSGGGASKTRAQKNTNQRQGHVPRLSAFLQVKIKGRLRSRWKRRFVFLVPGGICYTDKEQVPQTADPTNLDLHKAQQMGWNTVPIKSRTQIKDKSSSSSSFGFSVGDLFECRCESGARKSQWLQSCKMHAQLDRQRQNAAAVWDADDNGTVLLPRFGQSAASNAGRRAVFS